MIKHHFYPQDAYAEGAEVTLVASDQTHHLTMTNEEFNEGFKHDLTYDIAMFRVNGICLVNCKRDENGVFKAYWTENV